MRVRSSGLARRVEAHRGVLWYSGSNYLAMATTMISGIATARILGAEGRGIYAGVVTASIFLTVGGGLGACISFRREASLHPELVPSLARAAWRYGFVASILIVPMSYAVVSWLFDGLSTAEYVAASAAIGASGIATTGTAYQQLLVAQGRLRELGMMRLIPQGSLAITILFMTAIGRLTLSVALCALVVKPAVELILGRLLLPIPSGTPHAALRGHISFGLRSLPDQLAELGTVRVDQLLLLSVIGPADLGRYAVCVTAAGLPLTVAQSLIFKWFTATARDTSNNFRVYLVKTARLCGVCLALSMPIVIAGPWLMGAIYGSDFEGLGYVLLYLALGGALLSGCYAVTSFLVALGRPGRSALGWVVSLVISAALVPPVARRWSIEGAAALSLLSYSAALVVLLLVMRATLGYGSAVEPLVGAAGDPFLDPAADS